MLATSGEFTDLQGFHAGNSSFVGLVRMLQGLARRPAGIKPSVNCGQVRGANIMKCSCYI